MVAYACPSVTFTFASESTEALPLPPSSSTFTVYSPSSSDVSGSASAVCVSAACCTCSFSAVEPQPDKTDTHIQRDTIITVNFLLFILFLFDRMISPIHPICFPVTFDTCTSFSNTMYWDCRRLADNSHFIFSVHLIH